MIIRKQKASCEQARNMDLVAYLNALGFQPARIRHSNYWYLSPLRKEKTPSFKVNRNLNRWYDHGVGKGGNLIDFAILYNNCTVGEFLRPVDLSSFQQPIPSPPQPPRKEKESPIKILDVQPLTSPWLWRYLYQRRTSRPVTARYCKEITYELYGRRFYAIGFKNDSGGHELRSPFFKGSNAPKDITTIDTQAPQVAVFEGLFDFLSFKTISRNQEQPRCNFLVLNSTSLFEKARPFMERHSCINLYLDQDKTGQNYTRYALSIDPRYKDGSSMYRNYKDLNDWVMNIGKSRHHNPEGKPK